jgi:transmembrane sensor
VTKRATEIEAEAAAWLAKRDSGTWGAADDLALEQWRATSTAHHLATLRLETAWAKADRLRVLGSNAVPLEADRPAEELPTANSWTRRWYIPLIAAASLTALAIPGWRMLNAPSAQVYSTAVGGFQRLPLADGSRVDINTDTHLDVALGDAERHVSLDRGEAFFNVAHDRSRPFVIEAGDFRVTAIGTAFSVRRDGDRVTVAVTEGRVRVDRREGGGAAPMVFVSAGQRIMAAPAVPIVVQAVATARLEEDLSWRDGLLVFEEEPLRDVVAEFNRYNMRHLVVDPAVARVQISGTFRTNNVDGFLRLLRQGFNVGATPRGENEVMLRPS